MTWHEAAPFERGEYYWRRDSASPIFMVEVTEALACHTAEVAACVSPAFARIMPGQWTDCLPAPESRIRELAEAAPIRRRRAY